MDVFLARQPIFDDKMNVFAYELLYRGNTDNKAKFTDGDSATGHVVINSLILIGLNKITGDRKAFINFTRQTISNELPQLFSKDDLVVEILEDIVPDSEFVENCKNLKNLGYKIALDDFILTERFESIIDLVDIIKVDFMLTSKKERAEIVNKYKHQNISFLAEKIESNSDYNEAVEMGYAYFQGYFFSKPVVITGNDVKSFSTTYMLVMKELMKAEPVYSELEKIIEKDIAISYKLLRLINSPAFHSRNEIKSLKHALTMLGFKELKKWFSLLMIRDVGKDQPHELIRISLIRGKMCEYLCKENKLNKRSSEMFLMGLFSLIDVILNKRLVESIEELPLANDVAEALLGKDNLFKSVLDLVVHYEHTQWDECIILIKKLGLSDEVLTNSYIHAIDWVDDIVKNS